jgi:hypothetical protein
MRILMTVCISRLSATTDTLGAPVGGFQTVRCSLPEILDMRLLIIHEPARRHHAAGTHLFLPVAMFLRQTLYGILIVT